MQHSAWDRLDAELPGASCEPWLETVLVRNAQTAYLRQFGSPQSQEAFRERVPTISYASFVPWLERIQQGEADVLFAGRPVAYERTGGSTGGAKLIPYSAEGLQDFQRAVLPWLANAVKSYGVTGRAYLSISPATRQPELIGDVPVGLPDGAYLGEAAAAVLAEVTAVPFDVGSIPDVARWRSETLRHLTAAADLELISVWSPTFLLRLLDDVVDPAAVWPRLKLLSCWASGASQPFAALLAARLPHAHLQPKGLLSTECVVTVPDADDRPVLTPCGFFEFERDERLHLADELSRGAIYMSWQPPRAASTATAPATRALRRARSIGTARARVRRQGRTCFRPGGRKTDRAFRRRLPRRRPGIPPAGARREGDGYVLAAETGVPVSIEDIERRLCDNPQYAHARRLGQLKALRLLDLENLFHRYVHAQLQQGVRLGDVKPTALRNEPTWITRLNG